MTNIGGLDDGRLVIPDAQLVAFAGTNGTGKSRFLASLLVPWTHAIPPARDGSVISSVQIEVEFTKHELDGLEKLDMDAGWQLGRLPKVTEAVYENVPLIGLRVRSQYQTLLQYCFTNPELLKLHPSLNLIYLPAERRLMSARDSTVDLAQLAEELGLAKLAEARNLATQSGQLDDREFESYARALCVSGYLPGETGSGATRWSEFKEAVDSILSPKSLDPLTQENPTDIRIRLPSGGTHGIEGLSSGERQALIIVSRVFRAGDGHSLVAVDEPDAFLHPQLASRLLASLRSGLGDGRLIVATHSPAILDAVAPSAIVKFSHSGPPSVSITEEERLALYREAGFRASAITQADRLLITEGSFDAFVLPKFIPALGTAAIRDVGGRDLVLRSVASLVTFDIPVSGVVDLDVNREPLSSELSNSCHIWPAADIEGVLLSDPNFLNSAIEGNLIIKQYSDRASLNALVSSLLEGFREEVIAEHAQQQLRSQVNIGWPTPRGDGALDRLRSTAGTVPQLSSAMIDSAIEKAEAAWNDAAGNLWLLVRGKRILSKLVQSATIVKSSDAFVAAVAARQPQIKAFVEFEASLPNAI